MTYVVLVMCNSGKSCAGTVKDNDNAKHTSNEAIWSSEDHLFFSKSDRNLLQVLLAIKAKLWNSGPFWLAWARNTYTEAMDFGFNFGVTIG